MTRKPMINPNIGEATIGRTTFQSSPFPSQKWTLEGWDQMMTFQFPREAARAAPQRPPISAWLELEGKPSHHVTKFQTMPPKSAQTRTSEVTMLVSTRPDAMVLATAVPTIAPTRFVVAASKTACLGDSTFV